MVAIVIPSLLVFVLLIIGIVHFSEKKQEKQSQDNKIQDLFDELKKEKEKKARVPKRYEGILTLYSFWETEDSIVVYELMASNEEGWIPYWILDKKCKGKPPYITFYKNEPIYEELSRYLPVHNDNKAIWYEVSISVSGNEAIYDEHDDTKELKPATIDRNSLKILDVIRHDSDEIKKNIEEELRTKYKDRYIESVV